MVPVELGNPQSHTITQTKTTPGNRGSERRNIALVKEYLDTGHARKDRLRMFARLVMLAGLFLIIAIILFKYLPDLLDVLAIHGEEFKTSKNEAQVILGCLVISIFFSAIPCPGRNLWNLLVGFLYAWWGFCFLIIGHFFGSLIGFLCARFVWNRCLADKLKDCKVLLCCCYGKNGQPGKILLLILASMVSIEEQPFRSILLLGLSPAPWALLTYILGAKADSISLWQFLVPQTCSGVKLLQPIYLSIKITDAAELVSGGAAEDPVDTVLTIVSITLGIFCGCFIARYAMWKLKQSQEQLATVSAGSTLRASTSGSSINLGELSISECMSELSNQLFDEFAEAKGQGERNHVSNETGSADSEPTVTPIRINISL